MTTRRLDANFTIWRDLAELPDPWRPKIVGAGRAVLSDAGVRLATVDAAASTYSNGQFDDYQGLPRRAFPWQPPLTLTVRARFSHEAATSADGPGLQGTAGFGFWNDPFMMTDPRPPTLPRAVWFFYASPPADMPLALGVPGRGWKAAMLDALRPSALPWAVLAPLLVPLMNIRALYATLWPRIQSALHVCEALITVPMTTWHTYRIEWGTRRTRFTVDGQTVLLCDAAPRGPLGLVLWKDNQYLVATPRGRFRYGWLSAPGEQWVEIAAVEIATDALAAEIGGERAEPKARAQR